MGDFSETPGWRSPPHPQQHCAGAFAGGQTSEKYLPTSIPCPASCEKEETELSAGRRKIFSLVFLLYGLSSQVRLLK